MATTNQHWQAGLGTAHAVVARAAPQDGGQPTAARFTSQQVWHQVAKAWFAVLGYVTPAGEPRSSGVVSKTLGRRLYVAVALDSWKVWHLAASRRVAVTVPVRRGGLLSLVTRIPPATVSFHASAVVYPAGSPEARFLAKELGSLLPGERQASACLIEVVPEGAFVTYGLGVSLSKLRDPAAARARVPVRSEGRTR
jgi:hypothetical protein